MQRQNNKLAHSVNGNPLILSKKINILQLNASNSDFNSKIDELITTVDRLKGDIVIISESNMDDKDKKKLLERSNKFPDFQIVDKLITGVDKARVTILVKKDIKFTRLNVYEDDTNPRILLKIREKKGKNLVIAGLYRQWKAPGETGANTSEGIKRQCSRLKMVVDSLNKVCEEDYELVVAGDINID